MNTFQVCQMDQDGANICRQELDIEENFVRNKQNQDFLLHQFSGVVFCSFASYGIDRAGPDVAVAAAMVELQQILSEERDHQTNLAVLEPVAKACKAPYVGDADAQFQAYLASCFSAYWAHMSDYTFPYVTITQSSGFGKSRILQWLAETTAEGNSLVYDVAEFDVAVLDVCMRNIKQFTGYPRATSTLHEWLFPKYDCQVSEIGMSLLRVFKYAIENSDAKEQERVLQRSDKWQGFGRSGPIVEKLKRVKLESRTIQPEAKKQRRLGTSQ
ncbi:hypothetical protein JG688_00018247 [Phytophthora aleatoria]|uniref:Uncharacterized protein n=1 Tax=Phytophthora aleatoria TaxID=2496075 RepID=A0A8J5IFU7_9STRA|nr:hypothetical protein JG688_00018247 [Phytophthora aleatoria]